MQRGGLMHQRVAGKWTLLGSGAWQNRDSWPMPGGWTDPPATDNPAHPASSDRFNSDLRQASLLLRASRPLAETGRVNFLATAWSLEKGVPPEMHRGDAARFWRYPVRKRLLLGTSLNRPLGTDHHWDLTGMAAIDFFEQEIDPRGPDDWDTPLVAGEEYEKDQDRTGHLQAGLTRWIGEYTRLSLQGNARYSHHRESLVVGGPEETYAQWLTGLVAEGELRPRSDWILRAGAGWDHSATPESGDKSQADSFHEPALSLRLGWEPIRRGEVHVSASRRSRFPSLRELYSGALGKFVPNPDLVPEKQNLLEAGLTAKGDGWNIATAGFLQTLHDGIEKVKLDGPGDQFMRINQTRIRVPGIEFSGRWRSDTNLEIALQQTFLWARVKENGSYSGRAEDRPDYLSLVELGWRPYTGPGVHIEAVVTGPRWSADVSGASAATGDLRHLPAGVTWNLRLSWRLDGPRSQTEAHLRLDNVFDQLVEYQVGLPAPGRVFSGGISVGY